MGTIILGIALIVLALAVVILMNDLHNVKGIVSNNQDNLLYVMDEMIKVYKERTGE